MARSDSLSLAFRPSIHADVEHQLVRKLTKVSYRVSAGGGGFDPVRH
jgi:hypothetical protein